MANAAFDAYEAGRLAGANHFHAIQEHPSATRPANPYPGASYWLGVEWGRGFHDGFAQCGRRAAVASRATSMLERLQRGG
jgi:hypothetical protein